MRLPFTLIIFLIGFCLNPAFTQEMQKEVLLIGTMHTVPPIVKNSYRPLLKVAKKYEPAAIYVETSMPDDSLSWAYLKNGYSKFLQQFYALSDSLRNSDYVFDEKFGDSNQSCTTSKKRFDYWRVAYCGREKGIGDEISGD